MQYGTSGGERQRGKLVAMDDCKRGRLLLIYQNIVLYCTFAKAIHNCKTKKMYNCKNNSQRLFHFISAKIYVGIIHAFSISAKWIHNCKTNAQLLSKLYIWKIFSQLQITQPVIHSKVGLDFHSKMILFKCCESPAVASLLMLVMLVMTTNLAGGPLSLCLFLFPHDMVRWWATAATGLLRKKLLEVKSIPISKQQPTLVTWCQESMSLTTKPPHILVAKLLFSTSAGCSGASSLNKNCKAAELQQEEEKEVKIYCWYYQHYFACALNQIQYYKRLKGVGVVVSVVLGVYRKYIR